MAFPGTAHLAGSGDTRRGSALAFAADEAGAAAAALLVGILALPWAGTRATAGGLAVLLAAASVSLMMWSRRSSGSV
jgi:hypothetical protein